VIAGLLIARLALAVVFFLAGAAKLADVAGSRAVMVGFGLHPSVAALLGVVLPVLELIVAIALLPAASANWGAIGSLILLGVFIVGIANVLVRGREADCHCFGQLHSSRVGWSTLGRNVALVLIASFVLVGERGRPAPSYLDWFGGFGPVEWLVLTTAVFTVTLLTTCAWFGIHLMRQHGRMLLRLDALEKQLAEQGRISARGVAASTPDGLPIGSPAPAFDAANLHGGSTSLSALLAPGLPVLLVFTHPRCTPCTEVFPEIAGWQRAYGMQVTVALISQGPLEENRVRFADAGIERVLVQRAGEIGDAYAISATPSAVLISREGTVASGVAHGAFAIRDLVGSIVRGSVTDPHLSGVGNRGTMWPPQDRENDMSTPLVSFDAR
jgi:thiol-disulfide isomerase/thioredoxin